MVYIKPYILVDHIHLIQIINDHSSIKWDTFLKLPLLLIIMIVIMSCNTMLIKKRQWSKFRNHYTNVSNEK